MPRPPAEQIRAAVRLALEEDLSLGDVTTDTLFPKPIPARGTIVAHQPLIVAGIAVARQVFAQVDPTLTVVRAVRDGATVRANTPVLVVQGDARSLLKAERVALNFLQHLSGVATLTGQFCRAVRGSHAAILDTRKTTPGLRSLQKWAVALGGGQNHRQSLGDGVLIKDNHLVLLHGAGVGMTQACRLARRHAPRRLRIIAEAQTLGQVRDALNGAADVILL
ncbi:MAG: carboxylating nicotinate-nucleotide diphosphorylase, partial [Nitrospiraceae bacterium]